MPGFLLHEGAEVRCSHPPIPGQATPIAPNLRVKVGGQMIVTQPAPYTIAGCTFKVVNVPSPCLTAKWTVAAIRVRAGGQFVLLQDSQATCSPNGTPVKIVKTQTRVKGT